MKSKQRAAALVPYFLEALDVTQHGRPIAIYAQKPTDDRRSTRPVDTVRGLATALKLDVIQFAHDDFLKVVKEIESKQEYESKMVLICWEHHAIQDIAATLGVDDPPKWHDVYDRVWIVTFRPDHKPKLQNLPQQLLFEDTRD